MSNTGTPTFADLREMARRDLWCFIQLTFNVLHPGKTLDHAEYLDVLCWLMMGVEQRKYRRVIINMPPRHMKSMVVSIFYVAWRLGRDPTAKFITISYGDDLAHHHAAATRKLMTSDLYRRIFPLTILVKKAVDHITTTQGGARYATMVGSDIIGFGADEIIIDDPLEPQDATSVQAKEKILSWIESSAMTRFDDQRFGAIVLVMHRLAPDDLSTTLAMGSHFKLSLPLVAEKKEVFKHGSKTIMRRRPGDPLNPRRMSKEDCEELKARSAPHVWDGQYQQRPSFGGSGMLSISTLQRFDMKSPPAFELMIHSWDIGATVNGNASVCTKWGLARDNSGMDRLYLVQVIRLKIELPEVRAAIRAEIQKDNPATVILDERGVGMNVLQDLRRDFGMTITGSTETVEPMERDGTTLHRPGSSKIERFGRASLEIADGRAMFPNNADWLESFLNELVSFPNIPEKDQVDSMCQVIGNFDAAVSYARQNARRGITARRVY